MRAKKAVPKHFISEPITVEFSRPPALSKKPNCPGSFNWRDKTYQVTTCLAEWQDFSRHGRMAQNMQAQHLEAATKKGSWGVGRFFFDLQTDDQRFFRIYYDRAPKDALDRAGQWVLLSELEFVKD